VNHPLQYSNYFYSISSLQVSNSETAKEYEAKISQLTAKYDDAGLKLKVCEDKLQSKTQHNAELQSEITELRRSVVREKESSEKALYNLETQLLAHVKSIFADAKKV